MYHLNQLSSTRNEFFQFWKNAFKKILMEFLKKCDEKQVFILERPNDKTDFCFLYFSGQSLDL